jgi:hypothetical protein
MATLFKFPNRPCNSPPPNESLRMRRGRDHRSRSSAKDRPSCDNARSRAGKHLGLKAPVDSDAIGSAAVSTMGRAVGPQRVRAPAVLRMHVVCMDPTGPPLRLRRPSRILGLGISPGPCSLRPAQWRDNPANMRNCAHLRKTHGRRAQDSLSRRCGANDSGNSSTQCSMNYRHAAVLRPAGWRFEGTPAPQTRKQDSG